MVAMRAAYPDDPGVVGPSVDPAQLGDVPLAVGDVGLHVLVEAARLHCVRTDLGGGAEGHRTGGPLGVVGNARAGPDQRAAAYDGPVQDHGVGPDEAVVLDGASLEMHKVTNHTPVADPRRVLLGGVHDGAVLDGSLGAHDDLAVVATEHRMGPDRRLRADGDAADDHRVRVHECGRIDLGQTVAERVDGHGSSLTGGRIVADMVSLRCRWYGARRSGAEISTANGHNFAGCCVLPALVKGRQEPDGYRL